MIHFGFSYIGLIFLLMLFIPNIIWTKHKPKDYEKFVVNENKVLLLFERIGEILGCVVALIFSDFNLREPNLWTIWLGSHCSAGKSKRICRYFDESVRYNNEVDLQM